MHAAPFFRTCWQKAWSLWRLYPKGSAAYRINERWHIGGFFRYDWNETLRDSVSPSMFELGLTGWSAGFGINLRF